MHQVQQRLSGAAVDVIAQLFPSLCFQSFSEVFEEALLFAVRSLRPGSSLV